MAFVTIEDLYGQAEIIVFENAYLSSQNSLVEDNIVIVEGRLSIREDEATKIIAKEINNFGIKKQKTLILDITELEEETKAKLRGAIKYFSGDMNNISVKIKINEELKPCGAIYITDEILKVFETILGKDRIKIEEI
jgi:DNA polymerase-3 subunit alpha